MLKRIAAVALAGQLGAVQAHEFLTQIIEESTSYVSVESNLQYTVVETYEFSGQALSGLVHQNVVKADLKRLRARADNLQLGGHFTREPFEGVLCDDDSDFIGTCGVFDHFNAAHAMAIDTCNALALTLIDIYPDGLVPKFLGPATFTNGIQAAAAHHDEYFLSHGLWFDCVAIELVGETG